MIGFPVNGSLSFHHEGRNGRRVIEFPSVTKSESNPSNDGEEGVKC